MVRALTANAKQTAARDPTGTSAMSPVCPASCAVAPRLRVTANHRWLEHADGRSFLWLGDTAWELFHRLTREEACLYLSNRAAKGFTV